MTTESQKRAIFKYTRKIRKEMFEAYGSFCSCCGEKHKEFLTLDHVNGDGAAHREKVGKGWGALLDLRKRGWPKDGYTVLCMNCNFAKRFGATCPHKIDQKELLFP